jgi:hypothetical protein
MYTILGGSSFGVKLLRGLSVIANPHLDHLHLENVRPDGETRHLCYAFQNSRAFRVLPKRP